MQVLSFLILGQHVRVACGDAELSRLLIGNYGAMLATEPSSSPDLEFQVTRNGAVPGFSLDRQGQATLACADLGDLVYALEKDVTVELQKRRADLFFLHSAALEWHGKACMLVAESGGGKSTTAWALLHHGFHYLSDELSPVDPARLEVFPYPHALCLKQAPIAYPLATKDVIDLGRTLHVPTRFMPGATVVQPRPLGAIFLVKYSAEQRLPAIRAIGAAEASAHLYVNALNPLAHSNRGLDAAVRIAEHVPCFAVSSAELAATCTMICKVVAETFGTGIPALRIGSTLSPPAGDDQGAAI